MGVGKGGKEAKAPLDLKNFRKKGCFLSVEWEKTNFTIFGPPWKKFGKNPCAPPLEKILPTPMVLLCIFGRQREHFKDVLTQSLSHHYDELLRKPNQIKIFNIFGNFVGFLSWPR